MLPPFNQAMFSFCGFTDARQLRSFNSLNYLVVGVVNSKLISGLFVLFGVIWRLTRGVTVTYRKFFMAMRSMEPSTNWASSPPPPSAWLTGNLSLCEFLMEDCELLLTWLSRCLFLASAMLGKKNTPATTSFALARVADSLLAAGWTMQVTCVHNADVGSESNAHSRETWQNR